MGNLKAILQDSLYLLDDVIAQSGRKDAKDFRLLEKDVHDTVEKKLENLENKTKEQIPMIQANKVVQKRANDELMRNLEAIRGRMKNKRIFKK